MASIIDLIRAREQRIRESKLQTQAQKQLQQQNMLRRNRELALSRIEKYKKDIADIKNNLSRAKKDNLNYKKWQSTRAKKVWNNRIKGYQAAISAIDTAIKEGNVPSDIAKQAENIRYSTTRALEQKRARASGSGIQRLTVTKATKGVKIESGATKKGLVRTQTEQESKKRAEKIRKTAKVMLKEKDINKLIQDIKSKGVFDILNPKQKSKVYSAIANTSYSPLPQSTQQVLKEIDKQKGTTFLQKESQKRAILGISSADPKAQGFFRKPSVTEVSETLNTIKPSDPLFKTKISYSGLKDFNLWLEQQRQKAIRNNKNAQAGIIGVASLPTNLIESYGDIIIGIATLLRNPIDTAVALSQLKKSDITNAAANLGVRIQKGQPSVVTDIAAEIITQKYGLGLIKGSQAVQKLRPSFIKSTGETFVIKKTPFKSVKEFIKGENKGISKIFNRDPEIILKKQTVKSGAKSLARQTELAGKTVTAVNAAADQLTSWLNRKQIIRKPIPGEETFPSNIKNLLQKFDSGKKLTKKQFANINLWLKKNVAPNITLLERSLYADPASGLRISRLGITKTKTATLKDILRGQFNLYDKSKPQVLIFQNSKVAKFPKSLKDVEQKLKSGKKLTEDELNRLIEWQVETGSGKFKPVGSTIYKGGIELEVTLAPGEYVKRLKQVGFTYIQGKKVTFVTAEVYKPPKTLLKKIEQAKSGKLTDREVLRLEKELSKKLGTKTKIETPTTRTKVSRYDLSKSDLPVLRPKGKGLRVIGFISRAPSTTARAPSTSARAPSTTARAPSTTARAPSTTARAPSTTARAPSTTARAPSTTARSPSTTARAPRSNARAPRSNARYERKIPTLDSELPKNTNLAFDFRYIRQSKIKKGNIKDPRNKTLKQAINLIKTTPARSTDLIVVGITKKKDINQPDLKGFRLKRTGSRTLKLVQIKAIESKVESKSVRAYKRPKQANKIKPQAKAKKSSRIGLKRPKTNK